MEGELLRHTKNIAGRVVDTEDELAFTSTGVDEEIRIPNTLGFVPTRMILCRQPYPYVVGWARESLADQRFLYVKTSAPKGTRFCAQFFAR